MRTCEDVPDQDQSDQGRPRLSRMCTAPKVSFDSGLFSPSFLPLKQGWLAASVPMTTAPPKRSTKQCSYVFVQHNNILQVHRNRNGGRDSLPIQRLRLEVGKIVASALGHIGRQQFSKESIFNAIHVEGAELHGSLKHTVAVGLQPDSLASK